MNTTLPNCLFKVRKSHSSFYLESHPVIFGIFLHVHIAAIFSKNFIKKFYQKLSFSEIVYNR